MRIYDIIHKKRDGNELSEEEIAFWVNGYTKGQIPDYQISALLMAIYFRGMTDRETVYLTESMANSGDVVDLSRFGNLSVDKHSTGGVGDKTSLIVAPIVASLGGKITKMSGRGLGHTGGTVDKLESIPGYKTTLSEKEFLNQVEKIGIAVIGQTGNIAPADKKIYALRDVTSTVDSIPLITSSIMSKKIASGSRSIVLDVKVGNGAFMKTFEDAEILAEKMVSIGKKCGRKISAVLTDMNVPLGRAVGNSLEVSEAVEVLCGRGEDNLRKVCVTLASEMISLVYNISNEDACRKVEESISTGAAFTKMKEWISFQGGDISYLENTKLFSKPKFIIDVKSRTEGFINGMNAEKIGNISVILGAGRTSKEETVDHCAGIIIHKKVGDFIKKGDTLCTIYTNRENTIKEASERYLDAIVTGYGKEEVKPLIYKIIR